MGMPAWARELFERGGDSERDKWQRGLLSPLEKQWFQLKVEKWAVPDDHACYAQGHDDKHVLAADLVRKRILETALDLAWDRSCKKTPDGPAQAAKLLPDLNTQIDDAARYLAALFRQRSMLLRSHTIEDQEDYAGADPFDFWDAFEAVLCQRDFEDFAAVARSSIQSLLFDVRSQQRAKPRWPDLLDEIARRQDGAIRITDAGDAAVAKSKTNSTEWSLVGLQLMGALDDDWGGAYPPGFLLGCLKNSQLSTLMEVVYQAPLGEISPEAIRKLRARYQKRR
jgi:hypothetical protein